MATKKRGNKTSPRSKSKTQKFSPHYLALVLCVTLLLEGALFGVSAKSDWTEASTLLDMSGAVVEVTQDTALVFQPMFQLTADINHFYQLATTQMMQLLDFSEGGVGIELSFVFDGTMAFYQQAAEQMSSVLDVSGISNPIVSGISISR